MKKLITIISFLILFVSVSSAQNRAVDLTYSLTDVAKSFYGYSGAVPSGTDTLSRKLISSTSNTVATLFSDWFDVAVMSADTLKVSTSASFTSSTTVYIYPGINWVPLGKFSKNNITQFYVTKYGGTAAGNYSIKVTGR